MYGNNALNFNWGANVNRYTLVSRPPTSRPWPPASVAALQASATMAGTLAYAPLNAHTALHFPSNGEDVDVDVQVGYDTAATAFLQTSNEAITMTVTAPDGTVYANSGGPGVTLDSYELPQALPRPPSSAARSGRHPRRPRRRRRSRHRPLGRRTAQTPALQQPLLQRHQHLQRHGPGNLHPALAPGRRRGQRSWPRPAPPWPPATTSPCSWPGRGQPCTPGLWPTTNAHNRSDEAYPG